MHRDRYGFARTANARTIEPKVSVQESPRVARPLIIIGGPAKLSVKEALCIGDALKARRAAVEVYRIDDRFRMSEFKAALCGCAWLLLAVDEFPDQELEMLRAAQDTDVPPKIGIICLGHRVHVPNKSRPGAVDFIVRRTPGDMSLGSMSRTHHHLLVEDLVSDESARAIARIVVPSEL